MKYHLYALLTIYSLIALKSNAQITQFEADNLKNTAVDLIENLYTALNIIGNKGTPSIERKLIINNTIEQLFYNTDVIIEDDLLPARDEERNTKAREYLTNAHLFYYEDGVQFELKNTAVSEVYTGDYLFTIVSFERTINGKSAYLNMDLTNTYKRTAEIRCDKINGDWELKIIGLNFEQAQENYQKAVIIDAPKVEEKSLPKNSSKNVVAKKEKPIKEDRNKNTETKKDVRQEIEKIQLFINYKNYENVKPTNITNKDFDNAEMYFMLGEAKRNQKKYTDAEIEYLKAIKINHAHIGATVNLGIIYFNEAVTLNNKLIDLKTVSNKEYEQKYSESRKLFKKALPYFKKAKSLSNNNIEILKALEVIYASTGNFRKANEMVELQKEKKVLPNKIISKSKQIEEQKVLKEQKKSKQIKEPEQEATTNLPQAVIDYDLNVKYNERVREERIGGLNYLITNLLLPGVGHSKVQQKSKFWVTGTYLTLMATAGYTRLNSNQKYEEYEAETIDLAERDLLFKRANRSNKIAIVTAGAGVLLWLYDNTATLIHGIKNIKKQKAVKRELGISYHSINNSQNALCLNLNLKF